MEEQLKDFKDSEGNFYNLLPLPLPSAKYDEEHNRLPATYVNFLITNGALIYPTYSVEEDKIAHEIQYKISDADFKKAENIYIKEILRLIG